MKKDDKQEENKLISDLKQQLEEYKNRYLRALADYQNFEKRVLHEKEEIKKHANRELILKLLPFLDNLEKAEFFVKDAGLKLIKDNFYKVLKNEGLEEIDLIGREYDPHLAEVIEVIEGKQDNIIVEVLRKGYKYQGKVIRVAQVKVSKIKN